MAGSSSWLRLVAGYSAVVLVSKAMVLGTNYALALHLSNSDFGYVALAQAVLLVAISAFGLTAQAAYVRYSYEFGVGAVLRALTPVYFGLGTVAVAFGASVYFLFRHDVHYRWFALLPIAGLLASHLASMSAVARTTQDFRAYTTVEAGRPAIVLALVAFYVALQPSVSAVGFFVVALVVATTLVFIAGFLRLRPTISTRAALSTPVVVSYLLPLVVVQFVALLNNVGDRFFLAAWAPISEVGAYGKAYLVGSTLGMLFDSIAVLWGPYVVKHRERYATEFHPLVRKASAALFIASVALLGLVAWIWRSGVDGIAGIDMDLVVVAAIVTSAFVARIGYQISVPVLSAFDLTGTVARLSLVSAIAGLALNAVLIPRLGMHGAAIATWVSFSIYSITAYSAVATIAKRNT